MGRVSRIGGNNRPPAITAGQKTILFPDFEGRDDTHLGQPGLGGEQGGGDPLDPIDTAKSGAERLLDGDHGGYQEDEGDQDLDQGKAGGLRG